MFYTVVDAQLTVECNFLDIASNRSSGAETIYTRRFLFRTLLVVDSKLTDGFDSQHYNISY